MFQVDAFGKGLFTGNPAAVCKLDEWLPDATMQKIAAENNLSETAFVVKNNSHYDIRWFTPSIEVDLCGHATLATAFVLFRDEEKDSDRINFSTRKSGLLSVTKHRDKLVLDFPIDVIEECEAPKYLLQSFLPIPEKCYKGISDYMLVFKKQSDIEKINPNFDLLKKVDARGIIVTAPGDDVDFVSRFFAPQSGVAEDPVTGSAHTTLTVYWAKRLRRNELTAKQLSARKGYLHCTLDNDRVKIAGKAKLFFSGEINIED